MEETPETKKNRLATELAILFHSYLIEFANKDSNGFTLGSKKDFLQNPENYQNSMVYAASKVLTTVQPDLVNYTIGLDRVVAFVEGLKTGGWVLLPSPNDSFSHWVKGFTNLFLSVKAYRDGRIEIAVEGREDVPSLNLKAGQQVGFNLPGFESVATQFLLGTPGA